MKKMLRKIAMVSALFLVLTMVASCGVDYTDEEIINEARSLIETSFEINEIFFGKGLPVSAEDSEEAKNFATENGLELENVQYLPVTEDSKYKSIDDIKESTAKVYSASYCEYLYSMAFEGYSTEDGTAAVYAKYMEDENGILTARIDLAENELPARTYDFDTMKVTEKKEDRACIKMDSYLDGEKEQGSVTFTFVKEDGVWKLDTPTY